MDNFTEAMTERVNCFLAQLTEMYPDMAGQADFVRHALLSRGEFSEDNRQGWVRLGEGVNVIVVDKNIRFYQAEIGVLSIDEKWAIVSDPDISVETGDNVLFHGTAYHVEEVMSFVGVRRLKLNSVKATFRNFPQADPTYRQLGVRARIE